MANMTSFVKVLQEKVQGDIIDFPQNRTLYLDQFTTIPPMLDKERELFCPKNINEVFEHYCPHIENIPIETEDGTCICETFHFRCINDFSDDEIIKKSEHLSKLNQQIYTNKKIINLLVNNKLVSLLSNADVKFKYIHYLESTSEEISKIGRVDTSELFDESFDQFWVSKEILLKDIQLWISVLKEDYDNVEDLKIKYNNNINKATSLLQNNLYCIREKIKRLEATYLSLNLYFKNSNSDVNHLSIMNIDRTEIMDSDSQDTFSVREEIERNYDRFSLKKNYSFLVIPGYIGSVNAIKMWAYIAYKNKVILITDFKDSPNFDMLRFEIEEEPLQGKEQYLSNAIVLCNYVIGRNRSLMSCEDDDLYIPSSALFGGRISNTDVKISEAIYGNVNGILRGATETRIKKINNVQVNYLISKGFVPVVTIDDRVIVYSKETLGKIKYPEKRTIDWLTKRIQNIYDNNCFLNWNLHSKYNLTRELHQFLSDYKIPEGFIADYKINEIIKNNITKDISIRISIKLYDHSNSYYEIKLIGYSSDYCIEDWYTDIIIK